jgi:DNA-directed RNA polymerase subunit RPC12/RpoP
MDTMMSYINECVRCGEMSYEIEEGGNIGYIYKLYECCECGFQWEIIEVGNGKRPV